MQDRLVTVIIPCYNAAGYITEAINSILTQTYTNWECIVIDDHSTDDSLEIAESYTKVYKEKFSCFLNSGKGACAARNLGLKHANGSIIKFLDADDALFDECVLESQIRYLLEKDYDVVYGNEYYYNNNFSSTPIKSRGVAIDPVSHYSFYSYIPITTNFLINKEKLIPAPYWNEKLKSGQEFFLLFQYYIRGYKFAYQDVNTAKIRIHNSPDRISNKPKKLYNEQTLQLMMLLSEEVKKHNKLNNYFIAEFKKMILMCSYNAMRTSDYIIAKKMQKILNDHKGSVGTRLIDQIIFLINRVNPYLAFNFHRISTRIVSR